MSRRTANHRWSAIALSRLYRSLGGKDEHFPIASFRSLGSIGSLESMPGSDAPAGRLVIRRLGPETGPLWVLVHGLANTSIAWLPLTWALRKRRRLAIPELTALGGSDSPAGAFGVDDGTAVLEAWLDRRRAEGDSSPIFLAGVSLGGWIACRLALRRPDLIQGLALVNAGGYRDQDWGAIEGLIRPRQASDIAHLTRAMFLRRRLAIRCLHPVLFRIFTRPAVRTLLDGIREDQTLDASDLEKIAVPTLLVWGAHDDLFRLDVGKRMAGRIAGSTFVTVSAAAHAVTWERPGALIASLEEFADRWWPGTAAEAGVTLPATANEGPWDSPPTI